MQEANILLVDDETSIVKMVEMVLNKEGFINIFKAYTAREALEIVQQQDIDYIVLDVMLPDLSGFDLCPKIRDISNAYILFLTAKVSDLDVLTGFAIGGDDYVTKPFNPLEIAARIKATLKRRTLPERTSFTNLLEKEMGKSNTLHLVNEEGKVVQSFGKDLNIEHYNPIEILTRKKAPGLYNTRVSVIHDQKTNRIWVLHSKNNMKEAYTEQTFYRDILIAFIIVGVIILLITISIAVWHGFRYGRPIIIFTSWLERMEHGQYQEVLTENERKRIFRKNGKVKVRYRLYQEVFQAFYNMAETLSSTEKERKRLDQTREEWMTGISHDLRTPLASVQGYGHLLESDKYEWSNDEIKDMGKVIREKGEYMLGLVEDFSLAFQLKNNSLYYLKERILLNDFLKGVVQKYKNDRMLGNVNISFVEEAKNIELAISRKWFERIFDNLIMNAIKHNPPNTAIFVTLKKAIDPQFVEIAVEDQGVGMNEEMQENLFERYFRGTNTEEKVDGAGLGMSIAKEIVKLHNGEIHVTSAVGEGTVIKLRFPVHAKPVGQDE
ncbi:hybrid sensor histidine kinase/response regulator [Metabacillus sp. B2-18]|uniref:hybrid sensor histidine kinase/response regulator n=1 Tax=Metabacillus sp. B2-18 TaxID=2897333 RepID=UPI001E5F8EC0|nr:ATP-binding protein [Metabacillus sp. B2-18]UGB31193.1 response regulator [Metabacillus sp. B2-18]